MGDSFYLQSKKLGLRPYEKNDAAMIARWVNDPEVNKYFVHFLPLTEEKVEKAIVRFSESEKEIGFIIYDRSDNVPIGLLEIKEIDHISKKCVLEMAICIKEYHGKGYGTETILLAEKYIFKDLKLKKCRFHTCAENAAMIRLAKKMGYRAEGVLKDELFIGGLYYDEIIFSKNIIKNEGDLTHLPAGVLDIIGNTPVVEFKNIERSEGIRLFGKLEFFNPSGSVKDRAALEIIEEAMDQRLINKDSTIIECTSGNFGISLAMICAIKGLKCILVAPEGVIPLGKKKIIEALGAELIYTPIVGDYELSIQKVIELSGSIPNAFMPNQFENQANVKAHEKTTAIEIIRDFGDSIDAVVFSVGSGGTITGVGRVLKDFNADIKIVAVEPENCAPLSGGKIGVHYILGIGAGFIPKILDKSVIDDVETVSDEEAAEYCMKLARAEGIFCGISAGAALCGALKFAKKQKGKKNILIIMPDNGVRYVGKDGFFMDYFDKYVKNNKSRY